MFLKLDIKHKGEEHYKENINHDPGVMLTYVFYSKVNIGRPCIGMEKIVKCHLKVKT